MKVSPSWKLIQQPVSTFSFPASVPEETAIAAVKYLNWMSQPESLFALQNGEKGHNYTTVDANGIPTDLKNIDDTEDAYKLHATDGAPICNGFYYGSDELNITASANAYPGYSDVVADSLKNSMNNGYEPISFTGTIQARVDYGCTVISKEAELLVQSVTCSPESFDQVWDKYLNELPWPLADSRLSMNREKLIKPVNIVVSIL